MATTETTPKTETSQPNVVVNDATTPPATSVSALVFDLAALLMTLLKAKPATGSNSDYLTGTAGSQPDPTNLTPATRPDAERTVSELSNAAQPPSTPATDLSTTTTPKSTPAPTPAPVSHTAHPVTVEDEEEVDPKVAGLQAMFPGFDAGVLQSILEVSGGDEDQAIETLLSMSDPEYKPAVTTHQQPDQTDLDEQLAHRLHLEEQARADYEARHGGSRPIPNARNSGQQQQSDAGAMGGVDVGAIGAQVKGFLTGAAAKVSGAGFGRGGEGNVNRNGTVGNAPNVNTAELKQQFNEFAETGKKHFSTFMTKVKAKMQEYDIPGGQPEGPQQGSNTMQAAGYNTYSQGTAYGSQSNQRPQQQWYAQQPIGIQPQPAINPPVPRQQEQPVVGYNVDPPTPVVPPKDTLPSVGPSSSGASPTASGALGVTQPGMPQRSSFDKTDTPRPNFDTSRLGLKPKRPVSLVGNSNPAALSSSAAAKGKNKAEDDDDIEYA